MKTPQESIDGAADQLGDREAGSLGLFAQRLQLLVGQVKVNPLHAPIIHTFSPNATALLLAVALVSPAIAQEVAVPATPVVTTVTSYRVTGFSLEREPDWRFVITFQDSNGKSYTDEHYGPASIQNPSGGAAIVNPSGADAILKQLNTANLSTTSLMKRLLQHLVQHGKIPASAITGTPEGVQ